MAHLSKLPCLKSFSHRLVLLPGMSLTDTKVKYRGIVEHEIIYETSTSYPRNICCIFGHASVTFLSHQFSKELSVELYEVIS